VSSEAIPQQRQPWHDIHSQVRGEVVSSLYEIFLTRWGSEAAITLPEGWDLGQSPLFHWRAQVFCSTPANANSNPKIASSENGILTAYKDAVRKARWFIYIENQYFISSSEKWHQSDPHATNEVAEELVNRIIERSISKATFHVTIVIPLYPETCWKSQKGGWAGRQILSHQYRTFEYMYRAISGQWSLSTSLTSFLESPFISLIFFSFFSFGIVTLPFLSPLQLECRPTTQSNT